MKKILLSGLLALGIGANAQFVQNFDSSAIPAGWSVINGGSTKTFYVGFISTAFTGSYAVQIDYESTAAHNDYLVTPAITVTAGVNDRLSYFVKNGEPSFVENYDVRIATANTAAAFAAAVPVTPSAPAPNSWTNFNIDLSAYVGQTIYVGFHATSQNKYKLLFDDIVSSSWSSTLAVPGCAVQTTPANGATGVAPSTSLSWTAPTSGGAVKYYDLYLGTTPNTTTRVNTFNSTVRTATVPLVSSTTYYWKVTAVNDAGITTTCAESSFTTRDNIFAPYCGDLTYSNGIEPITSVAIADLVNTSSAATTSASHESFIDKIATVQQGTSYDITFKGNTRGNLTDRFVVFVDWNQDGDFLDSGETYFGTTATKVEITNSTGTDAVEVKGSIAVPAAAKLGNTRMRVKKNYGSSDNINPCYSAGSVTSGATTGYGQAEDYTLTVTEKVLATSVADTKSKISVYPNPVKDVLKIAGDAKVTNVTIYSADGKLVKEVSKDAAAVNVSTLKTGAYIVKVKTAEGENAFKVIKQ